MGPVFETERPIEFRQDISSVQLLSLVQFVATPWTSACQAFLFITNYQSLPKLMSVELVMPSNHLILCRPLLSPSIFPSIRVFSNESALCIRWPKYWNFSFNISLSNEHSGLISFRMDCLDRFAVQGTLRVFSNTIVQKHQFFGAQHSFFFSSSMKRNVERKPNLKHQLLLKLQKKVPTHNSNITHM